MPRRYRLRVVPNGEPSCKAISDKLNPCAQSWSTSDCSLGRRLVSRSRSSPTFKSVCLAGTDNVGVTAYPSSAGSMGTNLLWSSLRRLHARWVSFRAIRKNQVETRLSPLNCPSFDMARTVMSWARVLSPHRPHQEMTLVAWALNARYRRLSPSGLLA
jgi:hypothetical protein